MRKKLGISSLVLLPLLGFISCATTPFICEPQNARDAGASQAMRGEQFQASVGSVCIEGNRSVFQTNFEAGYQEGKGRYCDPVEVGKQAEIDGAAGKSPTYTGTKYQICDNQADIKIAYTEGVKRGLVTFCSETRAEESGLAVGEKGVPSDFSNQAYENCSRGQVKKLSASYEKGYGRGLLEFCKGTGISDKGFTDGSTGQDPVDVTGRYQQCSSRQRHDVAGSYKEGYDKGMSQFCGEENITQEARANASKGSTSYLPEKFVRCLKTKADLRNHYAKIFTEERKHVVESQCTFDMGSQEGRQDAEVSAQKKTSMPPFCDASLFSVYLNGYLEGWKQTKERICDQGKAYDEGYQLGRNGLYASTYSVSPVCAMEYSAVLQQKYLEGFRAGQVQRSAASHFLPRSNGYAPPDYGVNYPAAAARDACVRAGYSEVSCRSVTSIACIQLNYGPGQCQIDSQYIGAVDACLRAGYSPTMCANVKDAKCIESKNPLSQCLNAPLVPWTQP